MMYLYAFCVALEICSISRAYFDLCPHFKFSLSLFAAQALASVKTYTWRKLQRRYKDAPEDFPKDISTRPWPAEKDTAHSVLWGLNLWLLYAHCDVLSFYATNDTFYVWRFAVIALLWDATLSSTRWYNTALILLSLQFHFQFLKGF